MLSKKRYIEEYQKKYNSIYKNINSQQSSNCKKFLISICFLSLPLIFSFVLDIFILDKQFNEKKISLNTYNNLADEKIYKDILEKNTLNLEIKDINKVSLLKETYYNSKFEEVVRNYKNNLSINNYQIVNRCVN